MIYTLEQVSDYYVRAASAPRQICARSLDLARESAAQLLLFRGYISFTSLLPLVRAEPIEKSAFSRKIKEIDRKMLIILVYIEVIAEGSSSLKLQGGFFFAGELVTRV